MGVPHISIFKRFYEIKVVRREAGSYRTSMGSYLVKFWNHATPPKPRNFVVNKRCQRPHA
jgi:hypothetical protein